MNTRSVSIGLRTSGRRVGLLLIFFLALSSFPFSSFSQERPKRDTQVSLDFNNVDLPVLVKFMSELTGKNFVIDEKVRGKVTIFSPTKIPVESAFQVFLSVLEMKGLTAIPAGEVIQILPISEAPAERAIHLYCLKNGNAEEVAKTLTAVVTRPPAPPRPGPRAPGEFEGPIQVVLDKTTNCLVVTASPKDFEKVKEVIERLDVKKRQVYVEAAIMEVSVERLREIGVEIRSTAEPFQEEGKRVIGGTNFGLINQAVANPFGLTGLAVGVVQGTIKVQSGGTTIEVPNIAALIQILQSDTNVNLLSTPQILATDHQKARIVVGQNVPFPTGTTVGQGGVAIIQRLVERKDVGVTLEFTPEILEDDRVKIDIRQEISAVVTKPTEVGFVELGPTTNKREASTSVVVRDRQTIVLGGLMRDDLQVRENKIPILGDIPLLGWLFKFQSRKPEKVSLLVFLTPFVVKEPPDLDTLTGEKKGTMKEFMERNRVEDREKRQEFLDSPQAPNTKSE